MRHYHFSDTGLECLRRAWFVRFMVETTALGGAFRVPAAENICILVAHTFFRLLS